METGYGNYKDHIVKEIVFDDPDIENENVYVLINDIYHKIFICPYHCFNLMMLKYNFEKYYTDGYYKKFNNFEMWLVYYLSKYNMSLSALHLDKIHNVNNSNDGLKFLNKFANLFFKELSRISQGDHYIICKDRDFIELEKFLRIFYIDDDIYINHINKMVSLSENPKVFNIPKTKIIQD